MAADFKFCFAIDNVSASDLPQSSDCDLRDTGSTETASSYARSEHITVCRRSEEGMIEEREFEELLSCRLCPPYFLEEIVRLGEGFQDMTVLERSDAENDVSPEEKVLVRASKEHSDLVAGEYEGGLKIWECSLDLVQHVVKEDVLLKGKRVLELGCGVGLPGVVALQRGASHVLFQDYNRGVLLRRTMPSVLLNMQKMCEVKNVQNFSESCSFCHCSWENMCEVCGEELQGSFNVILTSETIYNRSSYPSLLKAMKYFLVREGGVVLVAAKAYYFGVGGSVAEFVQFVEKDGHFVVQSVEQKGRDTVHRVIFTMTTGGTKSEMHT